MLAEGDGAEEAEARMSGGALVDAGDGLDLGVIGGDAGADEAPGCGQALEHVDLESVGGVGEQVAGGVEAGRAGADHGDAKGGGCHGTGDGRGPTRTGDPLGVNEVLWPTELRARGRRLKASEARARSGAREGRVGEEVRS